MAIGKTHNDGVIIKSTAGFNYYNGVGDNSLRELYNPTKGQASGRSQFKINTLKVFDVVEIANNKISVRIFPDGKIEIEPSI